MVQFEHTTQEFFTWSLQSLSSSLSGLQGDDEPPHQSIANDVCVGVYPQISSESQRILCYQNVKNVFLFIFTAEQVCGLDTMVFSKHLEIITPMFVLQYFFSHIQYSVTEFVLYFSLIFLDPLQIKSNPTSVSYYPHWFALQAILRAQGLSFVILICCWFLISFWVNCICCTLLFLHSI